MLGTIKIGAPEVSSNWEVEKDSYGVSFLKNNTIRQRIRIGKNVKNTLEPIVEEDEASTYNIGKNSFISNSYANMSLTLLNFYSEDEDVKQQHVDDDIIFVVVDSNKYQLLEYNVPFTNEIVSTFKDKETHHYGCAIVTNNTDNESLITMKMYDIENHQYECIDVKLEKDNMVCYITGCSEEETSKLSSIKARLKKRVKTFMLTNKTGKLMTKAYLYYSEDEDYICENGMKLSTFVSETMSNALFINTKDIEDIEGISKALKTAKVRCVTIVDGDYDGKRNRISLKTSSGAIDIPAYQFAMDTFQSYVFRLNSFTGIVTCIKSN